MGLEGAERESHGLQGGGGGRAGEWPWQEESAFKCMCSRVGIVNMFVLLSPTGKTRIPRPCLRDKGKNESTRSILHCFLWYISREMNPN